MKDLVLYSAMIIDQKVIAKVKRVVKGLLVLSMPTVLAVVINALMR